MNIENLIEQCNRGDRKAHKQLFDFFSPRLFPICLRYLQSTAEAEDVLIEGMYKIFSKLSSYSGAGSFEGWMKRIIVNECLMKLRKSKNFQISLDSSHFEIGTRHSIVDQLAYNELLDSLNQLPTGYRTVFSLYVIEGYKHREIAELLGISINTSKSQLILARKRMQTLIKKKQNKRII